MGLRPPPRLLTTAASVTSGSSLSSRVGPLIAQYKTNTEDWQFASFLADFERVLFPFSRLLLLAKHPLEHRRFLVGSLVGRMVGTLLRGGVSKSLTLITDEPHVGVDVRSLMV